MSGLSRAGWSIVRWWKEAKYIAVEFGDRVDNATMEDHASSQELVHEAAGEPTSNRELW